MRAQKYFASDAVYASYATVYQPIYVELKCWTSF